MAETQKKPFAFELVYEIPGEEPLRNVLLTEARPPPNPVTSVSPDSH